MASVENANPTILNAAQLPSRQRKQHEAPLKGRDHHTNCLFSRRLLPLSPPLSDASSTHSDDSDGPDDDDALAAVAILWQLLAILLVPLCA